MESVFDKLRIIISELEHQQTLVDALPITEEQKKPLEDRITLIAQTVADISEELAQS